MSVAFMSVVAFMSTAFMSVAFMSVVVRFSSTFMVLLALSLLLQAATARAAPATRIRARIQDSLFIAICRGFPGANRANHSLKQEHPSRLFARASQTLEKRQETPLQGGINTRKRDLFRMFRKAGDPEIGDPAGNDAAEMGKVGRNVEREAVE